MTSTRSRQLSARSLMAVVPLLVAGCAGSAEVDDLPDASACGMETALIEAAQKEGSATLYTGGHTREGAEGLAAGFKSAYGIELSVVRQSADDIARMVDAELESGKINADVVAFSDASAMAALEKRGVLTDAEVPNLDQIQEGMDDPANPQVPISSAPLGIIYNSASDVDVPSTVDDLVTFDGTVAIADPGQSGTSVVYFSLLSDQVGPEFMEQLSETDAIVSDSALALTQLVLTGEADLAIPGLEPSVLASKAGGEPLDVAFPDGPVPVLVSEIAAMKDAPHPAAAQLLVGYQLCEAGQEINAKQGVRSILIDGPVPEGTADLDPDRLVTITLDQLSEMAGPTRERFSELFQ